MSGPRTANLISGDVSTFEIVAGANSGCYLELDPKAKRQITQLLDTSIEREELKQRVNAQGA